MEQWAWQCARAAAGRGLWSALRPVLGASVWAAAALAALPDEALVRSAAAQVEAANVPGGIAVVVSPRGAERALALASLGTFTVQALYATAEGCEQARAAITENGLYGTVSARLADPERLPYVSNLVALAVAETGSDGSAIVAPAAQWFRALAPLGSVFVAPADATPAAAAQASRFAAEFLAAGGQEEPRVATALASWRHLRKPWPQAMDDWTHCLHGADGNPVAQDSLVGPPACTQWIAGPTWLRSHDTDSSISTVVTARGRLFAIADAAPISLVGQHGLPDRWSLVAHDAFSGVRLWEVPIRRWGWREWKQTWFNTRPGDIPLNLQKRLVATADYVYVTLGVDAPVSQLDARTGARRRSYPGSDGTNEILWHDGTLIVSVPEGSGVRVKALEAASGRTLWVSARVYRGSTVDYIKWTEGAGSPVAAELEPSLNTATDGQVVALIDGAEIVALDAHTGAERWRAAFPADPADRRAGGMRTDGTLWIGTMIATQGTVVHASPGALAAFDAADGRLLWRQPKRYIGHLWYEWKDVFVIDGLVWTWSAELESATFESAGRSQRVLYPTAAIGYDLRSGEAKRQVALGPTFRAYHHHRCYRNKATMRFILASRRGTECVDLAGGPHTIDNWVRGTCHLGMMPANGLLYAPSHPCACYIEEKLNGFLALAPRAEPLRPLPLESRLERGPAFRQPSPLPDLDPALDWLAFRHDGARTGAVQAALSGPIAQRWRVPIGGALSAPVAGAARVFLAQRDAHRVLCLDAADGHLCWSFTAGGRIDSPPALAGGTVLFGSADGWVYALRAQDGALQWRFQAAPEDRQVAAFGQLESAWPVSGSVLVRDGTVYAVAGRSSHLDGGLFLYGLDTATGAVTCQSRSEGPAYTSARITENHQLPQGLLPDVLVADADGVAMRTARFDSRLNRIPGKVPLLVRAGYLDDSYFKRTPWTMDGEYGRLIVHDGHAAYYVRMFDSLRCLDPGVYFTPGAEGYLLFAKPIGQAAKAWSVRVPIRVRAMVLTPEQLVVAGPPDQIVPGDPLAAFEGRAGGVLRVLAPATGSPRYQIDLPAAPVFNGAAVARGRLFLALEDGSAVCFAAP